MLINPARNPSIFRRRFPIRLWYPSQHLLRQNPLPRSQFGSRRRFPKAASQRQTVVRLAPWTAKARSWTSWAPQGQDRCCAKVRCHSASHVGRWAAINGWSIKQQRQTLAPIFRSGPAGLGLKLRGKGRLLHAWRTNEAKRAPGGGFSIGSRDAKEAHFRPSAARTCARTRGSRANSEGAAGAPRARLRTLRPRGWR